MMNQENAQAQAQELTTAIISLTAAVNELIDLAKAEETEAASTTATETTATTETTTAPIVVLDDDDNVIATTVGDLPCPPEATEFAGSMIEQDTMDPMPSAKTAEAALDNIICDISTLYDVAEFAIRHEGQNIDSDHSPYAPKENVTGMIGDFRISISKEILKETNMVTGTFRMIVRDKCISTPLMDHEIRIINDHVEVRTSDNTTMSRVDKMKEDHDLMRFLEITDEVSSLVMSKYISK